jgi:hypothetical protein
MPPAKMATFPPLVFWMPKNCWFGCELSPRSFVEMSNALDVQALLIEMLTLPI